LHHLIERERKKLIRYVRPLLRETADMDAEDLVQDVLLKVLERADSPVNIEHTTAYIYRSLRNRVIDYRRTQKPTQSIKTVSGENGESLIDLLQDHKPNAIELLQTEHGKRELFEALECLSRIERQVIIAHELEGASFKEMTTLLAVPKNALLSHKSRALQKLKTIL
jgi:RNA polymerase sigma factor (sigma-70 family)